MQFTNLPLLPCLSSACRTLWACCPGDARRTLGAYGALRSYRPLRPDRTCRTDVAAASAATSAPAASAAVAAVLIYLGGVEVVILHDYPPKERLRSPSEQYMMHPRPMSPVLNDDSRTLFFHGLMCDRQSKVQNPADNDSYFHNFSAWARAFAESASSLANSASSAHTPILTAEQSAQGRMCSE